MGKKKSFINKKDATTYSLVYRTAQAEAEAPDGPDRVLVPVDQLGRIPEDHEGTAPSGSRYPPGHPLALLFQPEDDITEDRRRNIVEMGLPDDGYDYLKHLRVLGQGRASLPLPTPSKEGDDAISVASTSNHSVAEPVGPAVFIPAPNFVPPEVDVKLLDSRNLAVQQPAADDEDAAKRLAGVTAFSRQPQKVAGAMAAEVEELQQSMKELENIEKGPDEEDGYGDWLDEFVLTATKAAESDSTGGSAQSNTAGAGLTKQQQARIAAMARAAAEEEGESDEDEEEDSDFVEDDDEEDDSDEDEEENVRKSIVKPGSRAGSSRGGGSVASTVWSRSERHDRNAHLEIIDERFEQLALQYEEDLIGELDEDVRGPADFEEFSEVLDEFLAESSQRDERMMAGMSGLQPDSKMESLEESDPEVIARTKAAIARQYEREASSSGKPLEGLGTVSVAHHDPAEFWDCESILSLRSNTEHHPARIGEQRRERRSVQSGRDPGASPGVISLNHKTGLPSGYGMGGGALTPAASPATTGRHDQEKQEEPAVQAPRRKGETSDEKKMRKTVVKEAKRVARENKKGLKLIFKEAAGQHKKLLASMGPSGTTTIPIG